MGDVGSLVSPSIDLTALTNPSLRYDYHMLGTEIGTLEVIVTQGGTQTTVNTYTGQQQTTQYPFLTRVVDLSAFANQTVQISFKATRGTGVAIDKFIVDELCKLPSSLTATNLTATSADLGWTAGETETLWNVEWGVADFTQGTGTTVATTTNPHSLAGLSGKTSYEFYVQANCGSGVLSAWAGPFSFTTPCPPAFTAPYFQNFDAFTGTSDIDANCWSRTNDIGDYNWLISSVETGTSDTGPGSGVINGNYIYAESSSPPANTGDIGRFVSPSIDLSALTAPSLRFDYHMYGIDMGTLEVIVTQGGTETIVNTLTGQQQTAGSDPFLTQIVDLSAYANQTVQISFKATRGAGIRSDIAIDAVVVDELCILPSDLTATNLTATSVNLGWTAGRIETLWNVEWGATGFTQGTGTTVATTTNPHTLSGLTTSTSYEFYVQANCGLDGLSAWAGPFAFTTKPANDECANAISLTPGGDFGANPVDGSVLGATNDAEQPPVDCGSNGPGVWYSVIVPNDGNITIEVGPDTATGNQGLDSVIEVFSGSCGALTSIECDDNSAVTNEFSILNLTGLTAGSTLYIRVWESGGDEEEPFSISAHSKTFSISENSFEGFSIYPNPVTTVLYFNALDKIKTISVYNLIGQELLRTTPNAIQSELSMTNFQTGVYIVKVKVGKQFGTYKILKE